LEKDPNKRNFIPVTVRSSVAQAAMIGNPVSMPRVIELAEEYNRMAGTQRIFVVQVSEQNIMDAMIVANRNGHIACTQGGESLAGLKKAVQEGIADNGDVGVLDSTAHTLKFAVFQDMYFSDDFDAEFNVRPRKELKNIPVQVMPENLKKVPEPGKPLQGEEMKEFIRHMTAEIAAILGLEMK
jgi:threonine synthase